MNVALVLAGLALVAVPGWTAPLGRRLAPREWTGLTVASLSIGVLAVRLGLLVTVVPTLLGVAGVRELAEACHELLGPVTVGGPAVGAAAVTVLAVVEVRMARARWHGRRARRALRVESWIGAHDGAGDHEVVVIPTTAACAYAIDGNPPQVVVSEGLARALSGDELTAVVRHEQCHLRFDHQRHLDLALAVDAALGRLRCVRRSTNVLRLAVERWADEAAAHDGGRAAVRGAIEKVVEAMLRPVPVPAFTGAEGIGQRLEALGHEPQAAATRWRLAAVAPVGVLAAIVGAAAVDGTMAFHHHHHTVLGLFGCCVL